MTRPITKASILSVLKDEMLPTEGILNAMGYAPSCGTSYEVRHQSRLTDLLLRLRNKTMVALNKEGQWCLAKRI